MGAAGGWAAGAAGGWAAGGWAAGAPNPAGGAAYPGAAAAGAFLRREDITSSRTTMATMTAAMTPHSQIGSPRKPALGSGTGMS